MVGAVNEVENNQSGDEDEEERAKEVWEEGAW